MMGMEVERRQDCYNKFLFPLYKISFFHVLCWALSYVAAWRPLFVTCDILDFRAGVLRAAGNTPFFPRLSKLLICFLEIPPSSVLDYKWLRLKILPTIHLIIVSCFPFNLGLGLCIARGEVLEIWHIGSTCDDAVVTMEPIFHSFSNNKVIRIIDMGVHRLSPLAERCDLVYLRNPIVCGEMTSEVV